MKTARVPRIPALLLLSAVLAWGGGALHGQEVQPRPTTKLHPGLLDTYVGQYELAPKVLLTLRREGHHLMAQVTGQPWIVVYAESDTRFFWKVVPARFTVQRGKDGKVEGLLFEQGKIKFQAKRVSGELLREVELPEPKEVIQSPRLITLTKDLQGGNRGALKQFWQEVQAKSPLVEPVQGDARSSWVTLLWRGNDKTRRVSVTGGLPTVDGEKWLTRLADTDVWYRTEKVPNDARFTYGFVINRPVKLPPRNDLAALAQYMEHCLGRTDPLNPNTVILQGMAPASLLELSDAPAQPWAKPLEGVPKGTLKEYKIKSKSLKEERAVTVYTPANYDPQGEKHGLLVLFDGAFYLDDEMIPGPTILDSLIAKKKIQPLVVVFVKHELRTRNKDLMCSDAFADFLVKELVPRVRAEYRVSEEPARTIVGGLSLGGLMASYCGLRHSDVFGNVLSQSGSYWWYPGGLEQDDRDLPVAEPGWLTREYLAAPRRDVRFFVEIGRFEQGADSIMLWRKPAVSVMSSRPGATPSDIPNSPAGTNTSAGAAPLPTGLWPLRAPQQAGNRFVAATSAAFWEHPRVTTRNGGACRWRSLRKGRDSDGLSWSTAWGVMRTPGPLLFSPKPQRGRTWSAGRIRISHRTYVSTTVVLSPAQRPSGALPTT
jgi:enterochelin esterase family protein